VRGKQRERKEEHGETINNAAIDAELRDNCCKCGI